MLALHADAERLYVGGRFGGVNGEARGSLAAFALPSGELVDWRPDVQFEGDALADGRVNTLLLVDSTLYLGGHFDQVDGEIRHSVAAVSTLASGDHWVTDWNPELGHHQFQPLVFALSTLDDDLVVGGRFDTLGDDTRNNLALVDTQTGAVSSSWNPSPETSVRALLSTSDHLFAGTFEPGGYAAEPDLDTALAAFSRPDMALQGDWAGLDLHHTSQRRTLIQALAGTGDHLIVAGTFNTDSAEHDNANLAAYRLSDLTLDEDWGPDLAWGTLQNSRMTGVAYHDGRIYGVGDFHRADDQPRSGMIVLDAVTGDLIH